jgi:ubiquinone/menaquinone biosynthesis C-methylase UbiE
MKTPHAEEAQYWDVIAEAWSKRHPQGLWRSHSDAVNNALLERWQPSHSVARLLKTDLFDEAFGDGLSQHLTGMAQNVVGIDIADLASRLDHCHHDRLQAVRADVRLLPFSDESFDIIVCNSTLDHFQSSHEIIASLQELQRVLCRGGQLLLTLDNLANPLIALRNALPFPLLTRLGIVPYYVGVTYGPRHLSRIVREVGFEVLAVEAIMHCPRVLMVALARLLQSSVRPAMQQRFLRALMAFEYLSRWPTRFLTGHFIAIRARKPAHS